MAICEKVVPIPLPPPPEFILKLNEEEASVVRSLLGYCSPVGNKNLIEGIWNALVKAGVPDRLHWSADAIKLQRKVEIR